MNENNTNKKQVQKNQAHMLLKKSTKKIVKTTKKYIHTKK